MISVQCHFEANGNGLLMSFVSSFYAAQNDLFVAILTLSDLFPFVAGWMLNGRLSVGGYFARWVGVGDVEVVAAVTGSTTVTATLGWRGGMGVDCGCLIY